MKLQLVLSETLLPKVFCMHACKHLWDFMGSKFGVCCFLYGDCCRTLVQTRASGKLSTMKSILFHSRVPLLTKKMNMVTALAHIFPLHKLELVKQNCMSNLFNFCICFIWDTLEIPCSTDCCVAHEGDAPRIQSVHQHSDSHHAERTCQLCQGQEI
jgi:hypothetical protein